MSRSSIHQQVLAALLLIGPLAGWPELGYSNRILMIRLTHQKLVIVPVRINGQGPYSFLLDTGASVSVVKPELISRLNGKPVGNSPFLIGMTIHNVSWYQFESIGLEGAEVGPVLVIGFSLDNHKGLYVDGVLGQDILHHYNYLLDFKKGIIVMDEDDSLAASLRSATVPLVETEDLLAVMVTPNSKKEESYPFILDSGANCMVLFRQDYDDYGFDVLPRADSEVKTADGSSRVRTYLVRSFRIGSKEMNNVPAIFFLSVSHTAGRPEMGAFPLKWFHSVYFNHTRKLVAFEPQFNSPVESKANQGRSE